MGKLSCFVIVGYNAETGETEYAARESEADALNVYIQMFGDATYQAVQVFHVRTGKVKWSVDKQTVK